MLTGRRFRGTGIRSSWCSHSSHNGFLLTRQMYIHTLPHVSRIAKTIKHACEEREQKRSREGIRKKNTSILGNFIQLFSGLVSDFRWSRCQWHGFSRNGGFSTTTFLGLILALDDQWFLRAKLRLGSLGRTTIRPEDMVA